MQYLVSLPPNSAASFEELMELPRPSWFATADPPGGKLGSGGGTANLLIEAWRQTSPRELTFGEWLQDDKRLMVHGGGQSRRLPAYAAPGKIQLPMPAWRWSVGQRLDQTLLDLQVEGYERIFEAAPEMSRFAVCSGDVLVQFEEPLPPLPEADVVIVGLWVQPHEATHFGVQFCPRSRPTELAYCLQKPSVDEIREEIRDGNLFMIDSGMWLFSERAAKALAEKCGWDEQSQEFSGGRPNNYELYHEFALGLGTSPTQPDPALAGLTCAVYALPAGQFYHFGTSREMIESSERLQNLIVDQRLTPMNPGKSHPDMFIQNAIVKYRLNDENHALWIENAHIGQRWKLSHAHVLTGIPKNDWQVSLPPGCCLDMLPIGEASICIRPYGIDDPFRGDVDSPSTLWQGAPAEVWFERRGIDLQAAGLAGVDLQQAPLFPVLQQEEATGPFVEWLIATHPADSPEFRAQWEQAERLSAEALGDRANLTRLKEQRTQFRRDALPILARHHERSVFYRLDLDATARDYAAAGLEIPELPEELPERRTTMAMRKVNAAMFRSAVLRIRNDAAWKSEEEIAFTTLRETVLDALSAGRAAPMPTVKNDQIVWGRSPIRLDLAGGWTDTPPYCLMKGGRVVNLAADLNGHPPIQVFARVSDHNEIVLRSIDLGVEERVTDYASLAAYNRVGSAFAIPKAALALAGFHPTFSECKFDSLQQQLGEFGGGLELSLLAAVPKGSGLGTSSILASTVLGTLSDLCGLGWDHHDLVQRTLALEQMLTTGGGWQDQVGGLLRSIKFVETVPGFRQIPVTKWLPEYLFDSAHANRVVLLYYTGITRTARDILHEIVRGFFLNSKARLDVVKDIGLNADIACDVIQQANWNGLCEVVARSWDLNQRLDSGTNPPGVQDIIRRVSDYLAACKLLGAGGGGYLLMFAKDHEAAARIRRTLIEDPPNDRGRFVDFSVSGTGLEITRS